MIQLKKKINEQMKTMGLSDEEKIEFCFELQRDETAPIEIRHAANRIFCSLIDVHQWLCGMANVSHKK